MSKDEDERALFDPISDRASASSAPWEGDDSMLNGDEDQTHIQQTQGVAPTPLPSGTFFCFIYS